MSFTFEYLAKEDFEFASISIFRILHTNMNVIAPSGNSMEEDYSEWYSAVSRGLLSDARQIVLMYSDGAPAGFFQYYTTNDTLMMEEIQIKSEYRGSGIFRELYRWLLTKIPESVTAVEAYSHKENLNSQGVLGHLGLTVIGENKNGNSYHFRGDMSRIREKYE